MVRVVQVFKNWRLVWFQGVGRTDFTGRTIPTSNPMLKELNISICRLKIRDITSVTFTWAFQPLPYQAQAGKDKKGESQEISGMDSYAIIHSIKVTNTKTGGATKCLPCPEGKTEHG